MGYDTVIYETNAPTRCLSTYGTKQWGISDGISYDSIRGFDVLKEGVVGLSGILAFGRSQNAL
ncbi:hypothetical protein ACFVQ7_20760, partial [Bacillus velezensis]